MPSTDTNFFHPIKVKPIQKVLDSAFPDQIQIESGLDLPGENPFGKRKKSESEKLPFNSEICSLSKGVYLDLGPATRHIAPTAQVYCSKQAKNSLKAGNSDSSDSNEKKPKNKKEINRRRYMEF